MDVSALKGIRVLDFSHALAGPYCTLLLAQYGGAVYKIEGPDHGDMGRTWGPPFSGNDASFFYGLNCGKQGIAIDLKKPAGIDLCLRLIEQADVLIENFRPGTMDRLGLGYEAAHSRNAKLVYCSISGYGQTGPQRDDPAMDLIVQCSSGLVSITGTEGGEQVRCGYSVADITAGMFAIIGILLALRARDQNGAGQYVDVSMLDGMISAMTSNYMGYLGSGVAPRPMGSAFPTIVPYRVYEASDGAFAIAVASEKLWVAFCEAIERPDLASHSDYSTNPRRVHNRQVLEPLLADLFRAQSLDHWLAKLSAAGIPCSPVRDCAQVASSPQASGREMFPTVGGHQVTGLPLKLSETPGRIGEAAPRQGGDTKRALADLLNLSEGEIARLADAGVVMQADK